LITRESSVYASHSNGHDKLNPQRISGREERFLLPCAEIGLGSSTRDSPDELTALRKAQVTPSLSLTPHFSEVQSEPREMLQPFQRFFPRREKTVETVPRDNSASQIPR
jgi:hypothetical protein